MKTQNLFGIPIDAVSMEAAVGRILSWLEDPPGPCHYVVTPNVNHIVKLRSSLAFRRAYKSASMVLADGRPVLWASRMLGRPLPGVVPGSDLVPRVFDQVSTEGRSVSIFLLGAGPGIAQRAASVIQDRWQGCNVVGTYCPPFGFESVPRECAKVLAAISSAAPDLLIIGLGAPKQERWIHENRHRVDAKIALCVGATIDFLAGEKPRAPVWMRENGLEWLHRVASEPRRLASRYAHDAMVFPGLLARELLKRQGTRSRGWTFSESVANDQPLQSSADRRMLGSRNEGSRDQQRASAAVERSMDQLVTRLDVALGNRHVRLLQFLGTSWEAGALDVAFAYASISAKSRNRRVLLVAAEDQYLETGLLDCLFRGESLSRAIRSVSRTLSYATIRGLREPHQATRSMIADGAFWASLREGFDEVVVASGTPHASQFGLVIASNVDAVMMIVDGQRTHVSSARDVLNDLRAVGAHVLGTVMNHCHSVRAHTEDAPISY